MAAVRDEVLSDGEMYVSVAEYILPGYATVSKEAVIPVLRDPRNFSGMAASMTRSSLLVIVATDVVADTVCPGEASTLMTMPLLLAITGLGLYAVPGRDASMWATTSPAAI